MAVEWRSRLGPPEALLPFTAHEAPLSSAARRLPREHSVLALGPSYYEKQFRLIKKFFQSLRTESSEVFLPLLLLMGVCVCVKTWLLVLGGETECVGESRTAEEVRPRPG